MSDQYLSESGALIGLNPDILPETSVAKFEGSGPSVIRRRVVPRGDGTDFDNTIFAGKFKTNDLRNDPTNLFITAYREGPEDTGSAGVEHFYNGYGLAVMPLNAKSASDGRYNIFVVDNSLAVPRVVLENVIHTGWGEMPYLQAVSATLNPETSYKFEIHFGTGGAFQFFMAPDGAFFGAAVITQGAYRHQAQGTYYGVSMSYNEGMKWSLDSLSLLNKEPQRPFEEHLIDGTAFPSTFSVKAHAYAKGYDGSLTPAHGVEMHLFNYPTNAWDLVDSHNLGLGDGSFLLNSGTVSRSDYVSTSDGYIRMLLIGEYPSDYTDGIESYLFADEVFAENWDSTEAHVGGMGDAYSKESSPPAEFHFDMYNIAPEEWLVATNHKIEGDLYLPLLIIDKVESIDALGNVIALLVEGADYVFEIDDEYRTFSSDERKKIITLGGFNIRVTYRTFSNISAIQEYISSTRQANFADDLLAFVCAPWELFIVLDYRGSAARAEVRTALVEWIMGSVESQIDSHAIETELQTKPKVANIRVEEIKVKQYHPDGSFTVSIADSFTLPAPDFQQFMIIDDATHVAFTPESD